MVGLLVMLCAGLVLAARAFSPLDADLERLLHWEDCPSPCWLGIRPGMTTAEDAAARLRAHPWMIDVIQTRDQIIWRWSGAQPAAIDATQRGLIGLGGGLVRTLRIQTRVSFGEWWAYLGPPSRATLVRPLSRVSAFQIATYDAGGWQVISSFACPVVPGAFWGSLTTLGLGDLWTTEALNGMPLTIYQQPAWWGRLRSCRRIVPAA
jgi:hypothetical protein